MSERMVAMTDEQAEILEELGVDLMRRQDDRAMKVLSLSLAWKFAKPIAPPLPPNVVEFSTYSRKVAT